MGKFCLLLTALAASALCSGPPLLDLVMPDAKVIAGLQVDRARVSPFGQFLVSHMQPDDPALQDLIQHTAEIVMASNSETDVSSHWLILARGAFDSNGARSLPSDAGTAIEFPDSSTAIVGAPELVKAAMQRFQAKPAVQPAIFDKVALVSPKYDFWFVTLVPLSQFSAVMPDVLQGGFFAAVTQALGGAKFGESVSFGAELTSRTEKDAQALADTVRFLAGMLQANRGKSDTATQVSSVLDTLVLNNSGNVTKVELTAPEQLIEQIIAPKKNTGPQQPAPKQ